MPDADNAMASLHKGVQSEISTLLARLRRRQVQDPLDIARKVLKIMHKLVDTSETKDVRALIQQIQRVGAVMVAAQPHELVIGNMVRRVLALIREETADPDGGKRLEGGGGAGGSGAVGPSLRRLMEGPFAPDYSRQPAKELRDSIHQGIQELIEELSSTNALIAEQAIQHIHANEVILTHGRDPAVEAFLKSAHKKRTFDVIVAETAPSRGGHQMAVALAEAGISTTLIADAAVFALMARVNKVIVGAHGVMANGGLVATAGCHTLALAAQHASVPLVACAGLYKLTPLFPSGPESFNVLLSPAPALRYDEGLEGVHAPNPAFDYVPPELVSLHITNIGPSHASYIYRLLAEYYHQDDHALDADEAADGGGKQ